MCSYRMASFHSVIDYAYNLLYAYMKEYIHCCRVSLLTCRIPAIYQLMKAFVAEISLVYLQPVLVPTGAVMHLNCAITDP